MEHPGNREETVGSPNTVRVRQGVTGQGVRYVLLFSLLGAAIALVVVLMIFFGS